MFFIFGGGGWYRISRVVCEEDVNLGNRERSTKERGGWRNCDGYAATNAGSSLLMDLNRCVETKIAPEFILASPNPRFEPERKSSFTEGFRFSNRLSHLKLLNLNSFNPFLNLPKD